MKKIDPAALRTLERLLTEELAQCDLYLKLLEEEKNAVIKLKPDEVSELSLRRLTVVDALGALRSDRQKLVALLSGEEGVKASELVERICGPADKKRLLAVIQKIKLRVKQMESQSRDFNQIVNFSLGLVNGSMSLIWSATQPVSKVYNAFGAMKQGVQPAAPRSGSLLGQA
jgi:hypothetical protein